MGRDAIIMTPSIKSFVHNMTTHCAVHCTWCVWIYMHVHLCNQWCGLVGLFGNKKLPLEGRARPRHKCIVAHAISIVHFVCKYMKATIIAIARKHTVDHSML